MKSSLFKPWLTTRKGRITIQNKDCTYTILQMNKNLIWSCIIFLHEKYVYNIIITRNDEGEIQRLKTYLSNEFDVKNIRSLKYFLGIEVAHSKGGIFISQQKYIIDLQRETMMLRCKPTKTPIE